MAEDNNYGAAKTDIRDLLNYGGLNLSQEQLNQAKEFVKSFQPQPEPVDKNLAMLLYFSKMAEEASKPGATLLGSAATALQSPTAYLLQKREEQRRAGQPAVGDVLQVAELMAKPKPGSYADYTTTQDLWLEKGQYVSVKPADGRKPDYPKGERINLNQAERAQFPQGSLLSYKETKIGKPTSVTFTQNYWYDPVAETYTTQELKGLDPTYKKGQTEIFYDEDLYNLSQVHKIKGFEINKAKEPFKRTVFNKSGDKRTVYSREEYNVAILKEGDKGYIEGKSGWNDWEPAPFTSFNIYSKDGMEQSITNIHQYDKFFKEDGTFEDKYAENWSLTKPAAKEEADPRKFYQITDSEGKVERKFLTDAEVITKQAEGFSVELAPSTKSPLDYLKAYRKNYTDDDAYKEYTDLLKNYEKIEAAYELAYSIDRPQVADISMIFAYMKMLAPRSVVREGEQAQASGTGGALDTVKNIYNSLLGGGRLTDQQRKSFRDAAYRYYTKSAENLTLFNARYNQELDEEDYQGQRVFIKEPKSFGKLKVYGTFPKNIGAFRKQVKTMSETELAFLLGVANITSEQKTVISEEVNRRHEKIKKQGQ